MRTAKKKEICRFILKSTPAHDKIFPKGGQNMNQYIDSQISNMKIMVKTFEQSCKMAALKNDGTIDKAEDKQLKKIGIACQRFIKELEGIK